MLFLLFLYISLYQVSLHLLPGDEVKEVNEASEAVTFLESLGARNIKVVGPEVIHSCLLPSHPGPDANPSASLNWEKGVVNCFACGGTSLRGFAETFGVRMPGQTGFPSVETLLSRLRRSLQSRPDERKELPVWSEALIQPWIRYSPYLDHRGVSRPVQQEMKTGVNPHHRDTFMGRSLVQPRVSIPVFFGGILRGWTLRKLDDRQVGPKYVHSRLPRSRILYNFDRASETVIVLESPLSVLKMKSEGIDSVVATFGAQVSDEQIHLLGNAARIVLFPDGDATGYDGYAKACNRLPKLAVSVIDHGLDGKDGADFSREELDGLISSAVPGWRFSPPA